MASISRITPGRGRPGDPLTIEGAGFATSGANRITVGGVVVSGAEVQTVSATELRAVIPAGIATDRHVVVLVDNLDDQTTATWWIFSKPSIAVLSGYRLPRKVRGYWNIPPTPGVIDAEDFEHAAEQAELLQRDYLAAKGALVGFLSDGLRSATGADGTRPWRDAAAGLVFRARSPAVLHYAAASLFPDATEVRFAAGGVDTNTGELGLNQASPIAGKVIAFSVYVRLSTPADFVRLNRIVLYVNDAIAWDSADITAGAFPFVKTGETYTCDPGVDVAAGDRIGVGAFRAFSGFDDIYARAMVVVA